MMAVAGLFASCQSNLEPVVVDEVVNVSIEVGTPEVATRAYSDGTKATKLQYAVYDADGKKLDVFTKTDAEIHGKTTVDLQLTTGNTYNVLFWAAAPDAPYTVDLTNKTMTVDYTGVLSNSENLDAFYKWETIKVTGPMSKTVQLKRPFAQLNVGTNDFAEAAATGYEPVKSYVKVTSIFKTLDLSNGEVSGADAVEFALNEIPSGEKFPVDGYDYLAMNYLLVDADKEVVDVEFGYKANGEADPRVRTVGSVPVQRNHRTNLYGQLLTSDVEINVEILPDYDGEELEAWDGEETSKPTFDETTKTYFISHASELAWIAAQVNNGNDLKDYTVKLEVDINLNDKQWAPIGTKDNPFLGVFDGNNNTIKNLTIVETEAKEGKAFIGFFGYAKDVTIKNVTFENVNLNIACLDIDHSQGHIGAVAGSLEGTSTIENVTVKGDIKVEATFDANGASRVAVVAGGNSSGNVTMKNVHVIANEGSYLKSNNNVGALAGQLQGKNVFENCSSNIDVTGKKFFAGGIIGIAAGDSKFTDCHTTGDITITAGREGRANDHYRVGGIAGGWADNVTTPCVLTGCSYTGEISGTNADGSVASPLDYLGYVGRGYTLANRAGSKVIIDGITFVQKYNDKYGIYDVIDENGNIVVISEADLANVFANGGNAILFGDLELNSVYTLASGKTLVLDLNGKNISSTSTATGTNYNLFDVRGNLTVKNGTIEIEHTGTNMGWGNSTNVFNVTAGGVLNIVDAEVNNLGGSDMGFVAHLNNWGEVTLNVENSVLTSNYVAVRVFNSGYDMNNVTIKNTTLQGANYAFWVHNYTVADFGTQERADAQKALLNLDIFGNGNTFIAAKSAVRLGFTNEIFVDENGVEFMPVSGTEDAPAKLEDTFADINANPEKNPVIKVAAGSYVEWTTGAGHGSTPFVGTDNNVTETVTIQGAEGSVLVVKGDGVGQLRAANGAKLIFKDITVVDESESYDEGAWELTYLEFSGNLEFNNVTFQGGIQLDSASGASPLNATFTDCTFITNEDSVYAVWVCDGVSTFSSCKFQGTRGLKMHEDYGSEVKEVMIDACEFGPLSKKPGVAIGTVNADTKVTIQNSSFIGCQAGDQGNYIYETDTDVTTFTFVNQNNTVE